MVCCDTWPKPRAAHFYPRSRPKFTLVFTHSSVYNKVMATNLALDDKLIEEARRMGGHKTKKDAVNSALDEYVKRRKRLKILELFGTIDFDPSYDYKAERRRKRS